jgi:hypothetical protein
MKYTLISIGDSLTQGFRSMAVCRKFQEDSFPYQVYKTNHNYFNEYTMPYIKGAGFPLNIEYILYNFERFTLDGERRKQIKKILRSYKHRKTKTSTKNELMINNMGIVGFTTEQIYKANYEAASNSILRLGHRFSNVLILSELVTFGNLLSDVIACVFNRRFKSLSFSRSIYNVLGNNKSDVKLSQVEMAINISKAAKNCNRRALVTYWAGGNDLIGALISGSDRYITEVDKVLLYIEKTLDTLLKDENVSIVIADIPSIEYLPFMNRENLKPIFPIYSKMPDKTLEKINYAIRNINLGIYKLVSNMEKIYINRLTLIKISDFFDEIRNNGLIVRLENGKNVNITADYITIDETGNLIKAFCKMGINLELICIDEITKNDSLLNFPPKRITSFYKMNLALNGIIGKLGLYNYVAAVVLSQFNLNNNLNE